MVTTTAHTETTMLQIDMAHRTSSAARHEVATSTWGGPAVRDEAGRLLPATVLSKLADLACEHHAFVEGERYARAAIDARQREEEAAGLGETFVGLEHAMDLCVLAEALVGQARYLEARAIYREGLTIYRRLTHGDHA